jgi:hypothetical protein
MDVTVWSDADDKFIDLHNTQIAGRNGRESEKAHALDGIATL